MSDISLGRNAWSNLSLARQFALAGGVVMLVATLAVGFWVSGRIEDVVVRNTANATARYMDSFIAPLTQDLADHEMLSPDVSAEIERTLSGTSLGARVVSFKIWREGGRLVGASNAALIGQTFEVTEELQLAWTGDVHADFDALGDDEDAAENAMGLPLLEIYSPVRERGSGRVIAVAEFYEVATQLESDLAKARVASFAAVALVMALIGGSLFAIVLRGSRTIDRQVVALKDLSARNVALRLRVQGAAGRFSEMNEQALRRIGEDLHDGPAQLMGFAALRLDALRGHLASDQARQELDGVESAVRESIREVRSISRGLSLPDVDRKPIATLLQGLADAHAARTETAVDVVCDLGERADLPLAVKICVYRVAQEGLTNAWRHGGGKGQKVRLWIASDILRVSVSDSGPGLTGPARRSEPDDTGLGLAGLADRVETLGGHIELRNRPASDGGGAELRMTLDLRGVE